MSMHLIKEIDLLKKKVLSLGLLVSKTLHLAIQSVEKRDCRKQRQRQRGCLE